jgi:hypothetical protein
MKYIGWSRARLQREIREVRAKIDDYNRTTAFHEAGHAIIAIHLRVGLVYATLKPHKCEYGISAGQVVLRNVEIAEQQHAKKQIVVTCAGLESEKLFVRKPTPSFLREIADGASGDESYIKRLCKAHHIRDVESLRRKAATLVRVHRGAIRAVSVELLRAGDAKVSAKTIKNIYLKHSPKVTVFSS